MRADSPSRGVLYFSPQLARTRGALRCLLLQSGLPFWDPTDGVLAVEVSPAGLTRLSGLLLCGLSREELLGCRALLDEEGRAFGPEMLSRMQSLFTLVSPTPSPTRA